MLRLSKNLQKEIETETKSLFPAHRINIQGEEGHEPGLRRILILFVFRNKHLQNHRIPSQESLGDSPDPLLFWAGQSMNKHLQRRNL